MKPFVPSGRPKERTSLLASCQEHLLLRPPRAALIKVSLALFIRNFLHRYGETGDIAAKPQRGVRRSKIKGKDEELLPKLVKDKNDIHLREIQGSLLDRTGIEVSESSLCRQLNRLKLWRKKKFDPVNSSLKKFKSCGMNRGFG